MVDYSSVLTWRIPWTKEPGSLRSTGSQTAGHGWSNLAHLDIEKNMRVIP